MVTLFKVPLKSWQYMTENKNGTMRKYQSV